MQSGLRKLHCCCSLPALQRKLELKTRVLIKNVALLFASVPRWAIETKAEGAAMSQRAGHESVWFLTAVLSPDHWPAFQRGTVLQGDGCILFSGIPRHQSQGAELHRARWGWSEWEDADKKRKQFFCTVNNYWCDVTSQREGHTSEDWFWFLLAFVAWERGSDCPSPQNTQLMSLSW